MSINNWENCCFGESVIPSEDYPLDIEQKFWEIINKISTKIRKLIEKIKW